jgi:hypothetical protein
MMFSGHGEDYFYDRLALALFLFPFLLVATLVVASKLQERLRVHAARATIRHLNRRTP